MKKLEIFNLFALFILPYLVVFSAFFYPGPLVFADAPFFYPENLKSLFDKPLVWDFRNNNFGESQASVLWLYFPTFILGLLNQLFGLDSSALIRLVFYFPSTILAFLGSFFFIKSYIKNSWLAFLGSLFYEFNTHFLVLLDGGQVGVSLAYGLFPFCLLFFKKFADNQSVRNFIFSAVSFILLSNIDVRIAILLLFSFLILQFTEFIIYGNSNRLKILFFLLPIIVCTALINAFWVLSLIDLLKDPSIIKSSSINQLITILDALFLYNPHFPRNEFGKLSTIPFYFGLLPLLVFSTVLFEKNKQVLSFILSLLIFIFFAKGIEEPFGNLYQWLLDNIPFADSFRDSSKFFIPTLLFSACVLPFTIRQFIKHISSRKIRLIFLYFVYFYILFLINPVFKGGLTGVLAGKAFNQDYEIIHQNFNKDNLFFRSIWFPEQPPLAYSTIKKEAISANTLSQDKPFALMIEGSYDLFYFLHDSQLKDWFALLGIKYALFPPDERKKIWNDKDLENRKLFLKFIDSLGFKKLDWNLEFPIYQVSDPNPKIFTQAKVILGLGDMSIYKKLQDEIDNFNLSNQGFIFLEDGLLDPEYLLTLPEDSALLVLKDRTKDDIKITFLQKNFSKEFSKSDWGRYKADQYLDIKSELLKYDIKTQDLLFGKGLDFSTIKGEKIEFLTNINKIDDYYLGVRSISATNSAGIKINLDGNENIIKPSSRFKWSIFGPFNLSKGEKAIKIENIGGFNAVNIVGVFSKEQFVNASENAEKLFNKFEVMDLDKVLDEFRLREILSNLKFEEVFYTEYNPTSYSIDISTEKPKWLVFSDHYDKGWELLSDQKIKPLPFYSMINGFFIPANIQEDLKLLYKPQEKVDLGVKISIASIIILILSSVAIFFKKS